MLNKTFKLQSVSTKYVTNIKTKTCYAYCYFNSIFGKIKATGIAVCGNNDEFRKDKGRKLARARAELNAYASYKHRLEIYKALSENKFDKAITNMEDYIDHQKEFINKIK